MQGSFKRAGICLAGGVVAMLLAGCEHFMQPPEGKQSMAENKNALYSAPTPAAPGAAPGAEKAAEKPAPPGMNNRGEVVDSAKIEAGNGRKVKGIDGWDGEIIGVPTPGSKFERLQIGMDMPKALQIAGEPAYGGTRVSSTTFNPLYSGNDKYKRELIYPGVGRLVFGDNVGWSASTGGRLIWVIYNPNEPVPAR